MQRIIRCLVLLVSMVKQMIQLVAIDTCVRRQGVWLNAGVASFPENPDGEDLPVVAGEAGNSLAIRVVRSGSALLPPGLGFARAISPATTCARPQEPGAVLTERATGLARGAQAFLFVEGPSFSSKGLPFRRASA